MHEAKSLLHLAVIYSCFKNTGSTTVKRVTADLCPPKSEPCATSSVRLVNCSTYSRSTVPSAEEEYLHLFIDAEEAEVSSDDCGNADTEKSDEPEPTGVRIHITNEYAGPLRSREDVVEEEFSYYHRPVEEYYCRTEDWWQGYNQGVPQGLFYKKWCANGALDQLKNAVG